MYTLARLFLLLVLTVPMMAAAAPTNLSILTDEQLLMPLSRIARDYSKQTGTPLTVVLKDAEDTSHQIEQGLEAHVLITANQPLILRLTEQGLTDVTSRKTIGQTQLALVTASPLSKQALIAKRISFAAMLAATPDLPVFTNNAESYEGARAAALLTNPEFESDLAARLKPQANHDAVLEMLRDSDGLALILAADAVRETDISILAVLPDELSAPVLFEAVVLGSESMEEAKNFANYLAGREAQVMFKNFGFQPIN